MPRSWWVRGALYAALTVAALVIVAPTVLPRGMVPAILERHARRMSPAPDVVGGLRLGYEVDAARAVSDWLADRAAGFELLVRDAGPAPAATVAATSETLVVTFGRELADRTRAVALAREWDLVPVSEDSRGMVLAVSPRRIDALIDKRTRQTVEALRAREDGCQPSVVSREGTHVVLELPGVEASQTPRIRALVEHLR